MASGKQCSPKKRTDTDTNFCFMLWDYMMSKYEHTNDNSQISNKQRTRISKNKAKIGHYTENIGKAVCVSIFLLRDYCGECFQMGDKYNFKNNIKSICSAWLKTRKSIFVKVLDTLAIIFDLFLRSTFSSNPKEEATQLFLEFFEEQFSEFTALGGWKKLDQTAKYYTDLFDKVYKLNAFSGSIREYCKAGEKTCCGLINCLMDSAVPFPVILNIYCKECEKKLIELKERKEIVFLETHEIVLQHNSPIYYWCSISIKDIANFVIDSYDLLQNPSLSNLFTSNQTILLDDSISDNLDEHGRPEVSKEGSTFSSSMCQSQQSVETLPHRSLEESNKFLLKHIIQSLQNVHIEKSPQINTKPAQSKLERACSMESESKPQVKNTGAFAKKKSTDSVKKTTMSAYNSSSKYNCTITCDLMRRTVNKGQKEKNTSDLHIDEKLQKHSLNFDVKLEHSGSIEIKVGRVFYIRYLEIKSDSVFEAENDIIYFLDNISKDVANMLLNCCYDKSVEFRIMTDKKIYHLLSDDLETYLINCLWKSVAKLLSERRSLPLVKFNPEILNQEISSSATEAEEHCINLAFGRFKFYFCNHPGKEFKMNELSQTSKMYV